MALFSDEEANKFPPAQGDRDHKIILMDTAPTCFNCKIYPLSRDKQDVENKFIDENLEKGYIVPLDSPYGFSIFMVPKRIQRRKGISLTINPWMQSPERTSPHSPTSNNVSRTCKEWNYSANSIFVGDTITFASTKVTNGKQHSKHIEDYSNQKSCSLG